MATEKSTLATLKENSEAILNGIKALRALLPFVTPLNAKERRRLTKWGSANTDFLIEARDAAKQFPEVFPASFKVEEFLTNSTILVGLNDVLMQLVATNDLVRTNVLTGGHDTMRGAYQVYRYLATAAKDNPGIQAVVERLAERFKGQGRRREKPETQA